MRYVQKMRIRHLRGFTLIELLVTVSIVAILSAVAMPSFVAWINGSRVQNVSDGLLLSLMFARNEAVKRKAAVAVVATNNNWADGWTVQLKSDGSILKKQIAFTKIAVTATNTNVEYKNIGRVNAAVAPSFTVCDSDHSVGVTKRIVGVDLSGVPSVTKSGGCNQ